MIKIDRNNPISVYIKDRYPLTKEKSSKQTWHVSLDLKGMDFPYEPGDSIGVYAQNDPVLVAHLIAAMGAQSDDQIIAKRTLETMPLGEFLTYHANLARISSAFLKILYEHPSCLEKKEEIATLLEEKDCLRAFLQEHDPLSLFAEYGNKKLPLQEICDQFGPLLPRFYSVASSQLSSPNTLDLTVALFTWIQGEEKRYGVASHFLCHLAEIQKTPVPIFLQPAHHFRLPDDHQKDLIMIGPGTGIAPFRAFLQERMHKNARGKHWLFFGERNRQSDFFYESEWKTYDDLRLDTAFSRDQDQKIYVQHKLLEQSKEIHSWLEKGAHLYVCGDAKAMAKDVEKALISIIATQTSCSEEEAKARLRSLKKEGRYQLDVY